MVKIGWLALVQLLIGDVCFLAIFITLIFSARRQRSAPMILQIFATGIYVVLRLGEWSWQIGVNLGWISSSTIRSHYWAWHSIMLTCTFITFTIGFCWEHLSRYKRSERNEP